MFAHPRRQSTASLYTYIALIAVGSFIVLGSTADAGTITGTSFAGGPGGTASAPVIVSVSEGNDNQPGGPGGDNNVLVPLKVFTSADVIDIEFEVRDSNPAGVTEYRVVESVDNDTGIDWTGYRMQLGFGTGSAFTASASGDGLDFDAPDYDPAPAHTSSAFPSVTVTENMLTFNSGIQSSGAQSYTVRIDVPDGIDLFTLRQFPMAIPEPASATLLMGAVACALIRRRR